MKKQQLQSLYMLTRCWCHKFNYYYGINNKWQKVNYYYGINNKWQKVLCSTTEEMVAILAKISRGCIPIPNLPMPLTLKTSPCDWPRSISRLTSRSSTSGARPLPRRHRGSQGAHGCCEHESSELRSPARRDYKTRDRDEKTLSLFRNPS